MLTRRGFGLALGLVALALATVPAYASAHTLTDPSGVIPVGTAIWATSTNFSTTANNAAFPCEHMEVGGEVTVNSGETSTIEMLPESEDIAEGCIRKWPLGEIVLQVEPTLKYLELATEGPGTAELTHTVDFLWLNPPCHFDTVGTVTIVNEGTAIEFAGTAESTSPLPCPPTANVSSTFIVTTANGQVTID